MDPEYSFDGIPGKLAKYLEVRDNQRLFRRRAVLILINSKWELMCCVVEEFLSGSASDARTSSKQYPQAILYEDLLTGTECSKFAEELQEGKCRLGDVHLERIQPVQWQTQQLAVDNTYMRNAGCVVSMRFSQSGARASPRTLLAPDQPYYPDIEEAARDWLPLNVYHGYSDARNEEILFLLPETRGYITGGKFLDNELLGISVEGTEIATQRFLIKGAYWQEKKIHHFDVPVVGETVWVPVPSTADRLEYYLIDSEGAVFDFHKENRFSGRSATGNVLGSVQGELHEQVRKAVSDGEGLKVEFKPFVEPEQKLTSNNQRTKLHEIVVTVAAFSNTAGGHLYLGITDDCELVGIDQKIAEWIKGPVDDAAIKRYLGALKSRIKDAVHGDIALRLDHVRIDSVLIVVIEVGSAVNKPITVKNDHYLYARTGASSRKVPPEQWKDVLEQHNVANFFQSP